jgi:hypothetical protein
LPAQRYVQVHQFETLADLTKFEQDTLYIQPVTEMTVHNGQQVQTSNRPTVLHVIAITEILLVKGQITTETAWNYRPA